MVRRRERPVNTAIVLAAIQQTGSELIRQCGIAAAHHPAGDDIPSAVLLSVIDQSAQLHATLLRFVADKFPTAELSVLPKPAEPQ